MSNTHLAYPDYGFDKFSGTDLDQDAEPFIQLNGQKINFALGDAPGDTNELANYAVRKTPHSPLYSKDQLLSGMTTLRTLLHGRKLERIYSLEFRIDETNFDTAWKWNIV